MIKDPKLARQIRDLVYDVQTELNRSLRLVKKKRPAKEYAEYNAAVGKVTVRLLSEILEPLLETNPSLKPPGWDD